MDVPGGSLFLESGPDPRRAEIPDTATVRPPSPRDPTVSFVKDAPAVGVSGPAVIGGRYEVDAVLGAGGMGEVYAVFDRHLKRRVALKMIRAEKRDERRETRFFHEARAMASLSHPACVQVHDLGFAEDGTPFIVMELVAGEPLHDLIGRPGFGPARAALILHQVAGALHHAHELGIVHRDVKPANIIVNGDAAKLGDFGIAKDQDNRTPLTEEANVIGTIAYMPPEQTGIPGAVVDARSDVYSLGATLYECLAGRAPFFAPSREAFLEAVRKAPPVPPRRLQPRVPRDLEAIALRCLEKAKEDRYATARELQDELGRFLVGEPVRARPRGALERLRRRLIG